MKRKRPPSRTRGGNPAHLAPIRWSWDKLGTHFSPRQVPQRPPTSGILSPPASCDVRVNVDWLAHIIGALEALTQPDAWSERSDWAINQIEILMAALTARIVDSYDCGCDMAFQLRQKPGAPCVLQQSLDGGLSWSDAFDFSLCLRPALQPIINYTYHQTYNQAQTSLTTIVNTYNTTGGGGQTTVETIAPEFVNKGQAANLALCQACRDVVDLVCELEIERRNQLGQGVQAFALVVGAVAAAFLTAISAGAMTIAGAALLSAIVEAGATGVGMVSDALLRNTEARQAVACCMYNALKPQSPTKANFSASLGGCGFTAGSHEAQLAGAIAPLLADDAVHAAFLNSLNELARWAELGLISCPCDDDDDVYVIVRCALDVTVNGVQAESLGENVWRFAPPSPGAVITITSNVPPNVNWFTEEALLDTNRFDQVTIWYYSDLRPVTPPASYVTLSNVWYVQPCYTNGTGAEHPPQGANPTNAVAYPYNDQYQDTIVISFNW